MNTPQSKYCAHCKMELIPGTDQYREYRYSYETEEEPDITSIGLIYICDDCAGQIAEFYEDPDLDEY